MFNVSLVGLWFDSLTRECVSPYSNEFSICRQLGSNAIILSPSFSRCMLLWNICAPFVSRANLELLFVYAKFLFQHLSTEILTLCCFGVHRRVHGPQNRMKIEGSQQLNFRSENAPGTWGELGTQSCADFWQNWNPFIKTDQVQKYVFL